MVLDVKVGVKKEVDKPIFPFSVVPSLCKSELMLLNIWRLMINAASRIAIAIPCNP